LSHAEAPVYLDHAATTPVDPRVAARMMECLTEQGIFGNAASTSHAYGREAAAVVQAARAAVAGLIGAQDDEIIFTSGATESDNLALLGIMRANADRGRHLVTARTEHKAIIDAARRLEKEQFAVTWLTPDRDGIIAPEQVLTALRPDTQLVSIMHANNETGVIQDIDAIGGLCRERAVLFHSDAAQSAGYLALNVAAQAVDLLSLTAHKLYGPKGIGALC
jgi:cysteine desulfurase